MSVCVHIVTRHLEAGIMEPEESAMTRQRLDKHLRIMEAEKSLLLGADTKRRLVKKY
jgi:hypothetical protein